MDTGIDPKAMAKEFMMREEAKGEMLKGVAWLAGGGILTGFSYVATDPGGQYFLFFGPLIYGAYRFVRGGYLLANPKALRSRAGQIEQIRIDDLG